MDKEVKRGNQNLKKIISSYYSKAGIASGAARRRKAAEKVRDPLARMLVPKSLLADIDALVKKGSGKKNARWHVVRRLVSAEMEGRRAYMRLAQAKSRARRKGE